MQRTPQGGEDGVDEIIQAAIQADVNNINVPATVVLCTGDGKPGRTSFIGAVRGLLKHGWQGGGERFCVVRGFVCDCVRCA